MSLSIIPVRASLGNQVIQLFAGLAKSLEYKIDKFSVVYNSAPAISELNNALSVPVNHSLHDIFENTFDVSVNPKGREKTRYWEHGYATLIAKHRKKILNILHLKSQNVISVEAVLHIRNTDKSTSLSKTIYTKLFTRSITSFESILGGR